MTPPFPSPPIGAVDLQHAKRDVDLADLRPPDGDAVPLSHAVHDLARRQVRDEGAGPEAQDVVRDEGERQVLAERFAALVHQRQPVAVGVDGEAEVRSGLPHPAAELGEIGRRGLGVAREAPGGLEVEAIDLDAERGQERHRGDRAGTRAGVEDDPEAAGL